jgi:hypothetical protein
MLLVLWVFRLELSNREVCVIVLAYMVALLLEPFNARFCQRLVLEGQL